MTTPASEWLVLIRPRVAGFEVIGETLIQKVKTMDWPAVRHYTASACDSAEKALSGRGSSTARASGSMEFAKKARDLSYFLHYGTMPNSNFVDARVYKEIAEALVAKGQWTKDALNQFKAWS
jgi:hypothetical protein